MKNKLVVLNKEEKVCSNCKHLLGYDCEVSFGLRCKHPENQKEELLPIVPNLQHFCNHFEQKYHEE